VDGGVAPPSLKTYPGVGIFATALVVQNKSGGRRLCVAKLPYWEGILPEKPLLNNDVILSLWLQACGCGHDQQQLETAKFHPPILLSTS
jgi:hypothetical protein